MVVTKAPRSRASFQPVEYTRVHGDDPLPSLRIVAGTLEDPPSLFRVDLRLFVKRQPDERLGQATFVDTELIVLGAEPAPPEIERRLVPFPRCAEVLALHRRIG